MKDEIIVRYCLGESPEEIAKELGLSLEIVKHYIGEYWSE